LCLPGPPAGGGGGGGGGEEVYTILCRDPQLGR